MWRAAEIDVKRLLRHSRPDVVAALLGPTPLSLKPPNKVEIENCL
jgi:hypothetical protein